MWRDHEFLLVSDGGDVFQRRWSRSFLWSLRRSAEVVWNQAGEAHKRWLLANFLLREMRGAYWAINSSPEHYEEPDEGRPPGYSLALARDIIASVRTDYDAFSDAEAAVLENHGYLLADAAMRAHVPQLGLNPPPPLAIPHPAWMRERDVRKALRDSSIKRFFGRWC